MTASTCTVPLNLNKSGRIVCDPEWFLNRSEYHQLACTYELLICGQAAYGALYRAIANAKKSVSIICWGFQPSMYLVRNGDNQSLKVGEVNRTSTNLTIGQLLEKKAAEGVKVRVLCWADRVLATNLNLASVSSEANTPGLGKPAGSVVDGAKNAAIPLGRLLPDNVNERDGGEKGAGWFRNRNFGNTDLQHEYDVDFFKCYVRNLGMVTGNVTNWLKRTTGQANAKLAENLEFRLRGFGPGDRKEVSFGDHDDPVGPMAQALFFIAPSHHQKMALIDYEDSQNHVGFVMGHNLLDEYWDTPEHSYYRKEPHTGRNGSRPREDLSARVTGQIVGDLFHNFNEAWQKAGGSPMLGYDFINYQPYAAERGVDLETHKCMAQIVRTQPQYGKEDIKKMYLQNVENATEYIYFENQYFRWQKMADTLLAHAARLTAAGREPPKYGSLFIFVVTNSSEEGMGAGAQNTLKMLNKLGRADTMPEAARQSRVDDLSMQVKQSEKVYKDALSKKAWYEEKGKEYRKSNSPESYRIARENAAERQEELKALQGQVEKLKRGEPIAPEERPGLKIHVCTLVPPDTPARSGAQAYAREIDAKIKDLKARIDKIGTIGYSAVDSMRRSRQKAELQKELNELECQRETANTWQEPEKGVTDDIYRWPETYVHSKLMIIDDTFITNGSANINTRSMEVDSELNILHTNDMIARNARRELWKLHTNGMGVQDNPVQAFKAWGDIIEENRDSEKRGQPPKAALRSFMRMSPSLDNKD